MYMIYAGSLMIVVTIQLINCLNVPDPIVCPSGWLASGSKCYYDSKKSFDTDAQAVEACLAIDSKATLPTTHNEQELTSLLNAFKNYTTKLDVYIGLKFNKASKQWNWFDGAGDPKHYHPWSVDADYTGNSGICVDLELGTNAKVGWNTNSCSKAKNLVCQQIVPNIIDVYAMLNDAKDIIADLKSKCHI